MGSGALRAWLDPSRMAALDVIAAEINEVIRRENYISAAGSTRGPLVQLPSMREQTSKAKEI